MRYLQFRAEIGVSVSGEGTIMSADEATLLMSKRPSKLEATKAKAIPFLDVIDTRFNQLQHE